MPITRFRPRLIAVTVIVSFVAVALTNPSLINGYAGLLLGFVVGYGLFSQGLITCGDDFSMKNLGISGILLLVSAIFLFPNSLTQTLPRSEGLLSWFQVSLVIYILLINMPALFVSWPIAEFIFHNSPSDFKNPIILGCLTSYWICVVPYAKNRLLRKSPQKPAVSSLEDKNPQ